MFDTEIDAYKCYENALNSLLNNQKIICYKKTPISNYKGVHYRKDTNKWRSVITINSKKINLGTYKTELEAHNAYKNALKNEFNK